MEEEHIDFNSQLPTVKVSNADPKVDAATYQRETRQYEMQYSQDYKDYSYWEKKYAENKLKAFTFLWSHCSKAMQAKIESSPDYQRKICDVDLVRNGNQFRI